MNDYFLPMILAVGLALIFAVLLFANMMEASIKIKSLKATIEQDKGVIKSLFYTISEMQDTIPVECCSCYTE